MNNTIDTLQLRSELNDILLLSNLDTDIFYEDAQIFTNNDGTSFAIWLHNDNPRMEIAIKNIKANEKGHILSCDPPVIENRTKEFDYRMYSSLLGWEMVNTLTGKIVFTNRYKDEVLRMAKKNLNIEPCDIEYCHTGRDMDNMLIFRLKVVPRNKLTAQNNTI